MRVLDLRITLGPKGGSLRWSRPGEEPRLLAGELAQLRALIDELLAGLACEVGAEVDDDR